MKRTAHERRAASALLPIVTALALAVLFLALNAFFVAAEFALVKVQPSQLAARVRRGERRAIVAKGIIGRLDRYLSVTQLGITVASLGLGWVGEPALERIGDHLAVALTGEGLTRSGHIAIDIAGLGVLTYFHLLLGELVPKFIAIQRAPETVLATALPLRAVDLAFRPVLWIFERSQNAVLRWLGLRADATSEGRMTEEEILGMIAASVGRHEGRETQQLVERVMRLGRRPVRQMMVPRVDLVTLPVDSSGASALATLSRTGFSRIPLTAGTSRDVIVGYLYGKDLAFDRDARERTSLAPIMREPLVVPELRAGLQVLREMQHERVPLAVVVDEYGSASGIVTLEDLVEEVFGEIRDELDLEAPKLVQVGPATWDVDASATADVLRDVGVAVDDTLEGQSLANAVVHRLGRLPRIGDVVSLGPQAEAQVLALGRRRVRRVRVRVAERPDPKTRREAIATPRSSPRHAS